MDEEKQGRLQKQQQLSVQLDARVYEAIRAALADARTKVAVAVNSAMVGVYWEIGRQIAEAVGDRAEYGKQLIKYLSERLEEEFGKGFDESSLRKMRKFYLTYPIRDTVSPELTWSHYRMLIRIDDENRRAFYKQECIAAGWTVRQLERQINSFFYERLLATQQGGKESVYNEIFALEPERDPKYHLKDPYVLEFLGLNENRNYHETEVEQAIIDKMQSFLLEFGKGFSFVARQKRITTEHGEHYYIDDCVIIGLS